MRWSRAVGHYAPWILAGVVGALVVTTVLPAAWAMLPWPVPLALIPLALYVGISIIVHNRQLCERCVAALPLDASATAGRYGRRFRVAHLFQDRLFAVCYLLVVAASFVLYADPVGRYATALVESSLVYLLFVYVTHQRLQPWCPYCRQGGDERDAPIVPDPVSIRS